MKLTKTNIAHSKDYYWLKMEEDPKSSWQNLDHKIGLGKSNLVGIRVTEEKKTMLLGKKISNFWWGQTTDQWIKFCCQTYIEMRQFWRKKCHCRLLMLLNISDALLFLNSYFEIISKLYWRVERIVQITLAYPLPRFVIVKCSHILVCYLKLYVIYAHI